MSVSERIREARKIKGLTQKELGELLNVTQATVQQYERGKRNPKHDTLMRIASALGISTSWLLGYNVPMEGGNDNMFIRLDSVMQALSPYFTHTSENIFEDKMFFRKQMELLYDYSQLTDTGREYIQQSMKMALKTHLKDGGDDKGLQLLKVNPEEIKG